MKKILYKAVLAFCAAVTIHSCSLDEYNPTQITGEETLATFDGWLGLQTYCYSPLYDQMFSASDYLALAESGTDIWLTSANKTNTQQYFYYEGLALSDKDAGNKVFKQAYSLINSCNAVINRAENVQDGTASDIAILVAETKCLRAFYYLVLVTHYGNITLQLDEAGDNMVTSPTRNTYEEIYGQITTDLKEAAEVLKTTPYGDNYARISKKSALGLLARTYAQGAGEGLTENGVSYWQRAKEVAEDLITNMASYNAYMYDDIEDLWAYANNRENKEALFIAAGPQPGKEGFGTSSAKAANKLATYTMAKPNALSDLYITADNANRFYGRVNNNVYAPSQYLINCFSDYDKRWENSFVTAFAQFSTLDKSISYESKILTLSADLCTKYGIAPEHIGKKIYPYVDLDVENFGSNGGDLYQAKVWPKGDYSADPENLYQPKNAFLHPYPLPEDEDRFLFYLSKTPLSAADKAKRAYFCLNIDDLFGSDGMYKSASFDGTNSYQLFPSLYKFNWSYHDLDSDNIQARTGDMFIMRMAEVYLIAAEANQMLGDGAKAAEHLNVLRKRACRNAADYETHMKLTTATENDVLDEYARELCGEFGRWALLKRHKAFESRLPLYNPRAAASFKAPLHYLRPISFDFLNQIDNAEEYGTNGY